MWAWLENSAVGRVARFTKRWRYAADVRRTSAEDVEGPQKKNDTGRKRRNGQHAAQRPQARPHPVLSGSGAGEPDVGLSILRREDRDRAARPNCRCLDSAGPLNRAVRAASPHKPGQEAGATVDARGLAGPFPRV